MNRTRSASLSLAVLALIGLAPFLFSTPPGAYAQQHEKASQATPAKKKRTIAHNPGQFFAVVEPIRQDQIESLKSAVQPYLQRSAESGQRPILIFEFRPGESRPGQSTFGASTDLADYLIEGLQGSAAKTVAYVPESLRGFAVLPVLACDEIVMGPDATLGPIGSPSETIDDRERVTVEALAEDKGRGALENLFLGMLEPAKDLREVHTVDRKTFFVPAEELEAFRETHSVQVDQSAWEGGARGVVTSNRARQLFVRLQPNNRAEVAEAYNLASASDDPTLGTTIKAIRIPIEGPIDQIKESTLVRHILKARQQEVNLIFFEINSPGGQSGAVDRLADQIARLKDVKTVAYIDDRALGVASLVALACDEIVFRSSSIMGGEAIDLDPEMLGPLADRAAALARQKGHPEAVARALIDPSARVHRARDADVGAVRFVLDSDVQADPKRFQVVETPEQEDGQPLTITAERAGQFDLSERTVSDFDELQDLYGLHGKLVRQDRPTWVDTLVETLNLSWMKGLLLFVGFFMLVLELKLPGVGLPAITAALAFLLYFWSSYLGGTADGLEILLFLVGVVCLALELFVFPGFGIFGMSGVLMILASVVMASHTFVWPTQGYEFRQMGVSLIRLIVVFMAVVGGAVAFGRYFPSLPLFNRIVLKPEVYDPTAEDPLAKPNPDSEPTLFFLVGEVGRTTTVLRPTGKARFGELLVDVTADGFFIEANQPVEVVEVRGSRVLVKRV